jgi:hypothetical protein
MTPSIPIAPAWRRARRRQGRPAAPRSAVAPLRFALLDPVCARRLVNNTVGTEKRFSVEQRN